MPFRFVVHKDRSRVHATAEEPLTDADLRSYQTALAADPDHGAGFDQLIDLRGIGGLAVTTLGVQQAGVLTGTFEQHLGGTRCAAIVGSDLTFGMARMFEAHVPATMEFGVFTNLAEAERWLDREDDEE